MKELDLIAAALQSAPRQAVLATVIRVEGSAYRKEGACRLLLPGCCGVGVISAGCLESDLEARFPRLWEQGEARTLVYDMSSEDDLSWGQGAGCNGVIHVLAEPVDERMRRDWLQMQALVQCGMPVLLVKQLTAEGSVARTCYLTRTGDAFGNWGAGIERVAEEAWRQIGQSRKSGLCRLEGAEGECYLQVMLPKPRLLLVGAGEDARPLAAFAAEAGYAVTVADWRADACSRVHFPQADRLFVGPLSEVLAALTWSAEDAVVIMTHNFRRDQEALHLLLQNKPGYLGVLGPRHRTSRLLKGEEIPEDVRSPVGLPIGAEGPEEIAVSILAELIQTRRRK
ncbi:xanthine dehydrogenase accessory factor [Tumebacillus sp. BK434]|uniref:XdhC family protein n=1 Tax=Tumebacillus sp. BK434 TaxID=2512169 RepID=UPI00104D2831|nr:XdhC/CoxI family protein [Tumebacillus sp. BK434]TCP55734.1 xanthine dehydrogenase accessory factor [Tumebacillus sp. BK434]